MSRRFLKKWIVDTVNDEITGDAYSVSVDPKEGVFWVLFENAEIVGDDVQACRQALREALKAHRNLVWEKVILLGVKLSTGSWRGHGAEHEPEAIVGIDKLIRVERAPCKRRDSYGKMQDSYRWRAFGYDGSDTEGDHSGRHSESWNDYVLPYTDELWIRLTVIEASIKEANRRLALILGPDASEDGHDPKALVDRVMALGTPLLTMKDET